LSARDLTARRQERALKSPFLKRQSELAARFLLREGGGGLVLVKGLNSTSK